MNGSPHSGQNFGGFAGSAGVQPHLLHLYLITAAGRFAPHSEQNLPVLCAPQVQTQPLSAGRAVPHSGQNLPVAVFPHSGQTQLSAGFASGFLAPHSGQNFPVTVFPQPGQIQLSAAGACAGAG